MKLKFQTLPALLAVALLILAGPLMAQESSGNVYVVVTDTDGNPLPGVSIELSGFGANQIQVTGSKGDARFLKLDPGAWQLRATLDGFSTVEYPAVDVRIARSTTIEVEMSSAVEEVITVTSESPLLDERRSSAGATISQIELEKIPTARDPWSVLSQTPGVVVDRINVGGNESGQQSTFRGPGASDDENTFLVDGVEITDMASVGASSTYYDFDQFSEMQFSTGGTDTSKSTSGVSVNLVTKRGTNEFRGSARFLVTDSNGLAFAKQSGADISPSELAASQTGFIGNGINKIEEWGFEAGGPVIRDRLWFWGSHGQNDIKNLTGGADPSDVQSDDTILTNTAFKVNAQITGSNSFTGSWNNGDKEKFGRNASPTRPQPTTWDQRGPSAIIKFEDTHIINSNFFVTGGYSKVDGGFSLTAKATAALGTATPMAYQDDSGVWQNSFWSGGSARPSEEFKADGSYFFSTGDVSHELKFGARLREFDRASNFGWPNDNAWGIGTPSATSATLLITQRGADPPVNQEYTSAWIQDTISTGNLTINAGLRYDLQQGTNEAVTADANPWFPTVHPSVSFNGADAPFDWTTISPRVGLTYALGEERKTLLRASYSRFPEQLSTGDIDRVNPAGASYLTLAWYDTDGSGDFNGSTLAGNGPDNVTIIATGGFSLANPTALVSPNVSDPGLDPEMTDEILLGIEHALLPEFVIGAQFTWRQISDVLETVAFVSGDGGVTQRLVQNSDFVPDGPSLTGTLPNGQGYDVQPWALDPSLSFIGGSLLRNGDRERSYQGFNLNFTKRLSNQWMLRGYFQVGEAEWDVPASFLANQSPNQCEDAGTFGCFGTSFDGGVYAVQAAGSGAKADVWIQSGWQYNVNGMYQVAPDRPWGFNVAANIFGREGYPLPYYLDVTTSDGQARDLLAVNELDDIRVDDILTVDLRLDKEFAASGNVSFTIGADVFNLLNENYTMQRERKLLATSADFLRETLSPRIWRLSARVNWK